MLKRILFALLTVAFFCSYSVTYTSVSDECPYIRFSGTTLKDIVVDKSHIKLEQTNTSVIVTFLNGGAQTITWSSAQARSYGYSLDSLYDYVLDILKVQCDTSGGGGGGSGTVTSIATDATLTGGTITSSGTLKVDTTIISTKGNVTGLLLNKQDNLVSGTNIKTVNSNSLVGSGNVSVGTVTSVGTGVGLSGGTITGSGTIVADTSGTLVTKTFLTSSLSGISGGGGSSALSSLTAATATNTIDNKAYQQTWKWDSLSSGTGMKISTASTLASGNTQTLFEIEQTGTNATSLLKTYATKIKSTKSSNSNSNVALYLEASGVSNGGALNSRALEIGGGEIYINTGGTTNPVFRFASGAYWFDNTVGLQTFNAPAGTNTGFSFYPNSVYGINFQNHFSSTAGFGFSNYSSTRNAMLFGAQGYFASYYAQQASAVVLERDKDVFSISADSATGSTFFTPTKILSVRGKTTNVGIGTQLPDASAILDLTSTTKGFLPPRMTSTQGSALTPIEGLLIYVTDTNGTFTSKGWWGYNGSAWEKLNN